MRRKEKEKNSANSEKQKEKKSSSAKEQKDKNADELLNARA